MPIGQLCLLKQFLCSHSNVSSLSHCYIKVIYRSHQGDFIKETSKSPCYPITCMLLINSLKSVEILKDIWKVGHYQVSLNLTKTQVKSSTYTKDNLLLQFW